MPLGLNLIAAIQTADKADWEIYSEAHKAAVSDAIQEVRLHAPR